MMIQFYHGRTTGLVRCWALFAGLLATAVGANRSLRYRSSCTGWNTLRCERSYVCADGSYVGTSPQCYNGQVVCAVCYDGSLPVSPDCGANLLGCSAGYYCQDGSYIPSYPHCVAGNPVCAKCPDGSDPRVTPYEIVEDNSTNSTEDCGLSWIRCASQYYCLDGSQVYAAPQCINGSPNCAVCPDGSNPSVTPYDCSTQLLRCNASTYYCPDGSQVGRSPLCLEGRGVCALCPDQSAASFTPLTVVEPACDLSDIFCAQVMYYCPDGSQVPPGPLCVNGVATCTPICANGLPASFTRPSSLPYYTTTSSYSNNVATTTSSACDWSTVSCASTYYCPDGRTVPATPTCWQGRAMCAICPDGTTPTERPY